jgi:hypothetical protein
MTQANPMSRRALLSVGVLATRICVVLSVDDFTAATGRHEGEFRSD